MNHQKTYTQLIKNPLIFIIALLALWSGQVKANNPTQIDKQQLEAQAKTFQSAFELAQQGKLQKALETWKNLAADSVMIPELKRAVENNIAVILMDQGRYEEAKQHFNAAIKANAQLATTIDNLNKIYAYDARQAYSKVFKDTEVTAPRGEMLFFDVKKAELPNDKVITDIRFADSSTVVLKATEAWRNAWQNQDIKAYLSFYDEQAFIPKGGMSYETWKSGRYRSVQGPEFIKVATDNVKAAVISSDLIRVSFYQKYESDRFKDDINKVLLWQKGANGWKIVQEVVIYTDE